MSGAWFAPNSRSVRRLRESPETSRDAAVVPQRAVEVPLGSESGGREQDDRDVKATAGRMKRPSPGEVPPEADEQSGHQHEKDETRGSGPEGDKLSLRYQDTHCGDRADGDDRDQRAPIRDPFAAEQGHRREVAGDGVEPEEHRHLHGGSPPRSCFPLKPSPMARRSCECQP